MQSPLDMHQGKCLYTLQDTFHEEIRNLEATWEYLEETKGCDRMGQQLCDHGEEDFHSIPTTLTVQDTL